MQQTNLSKAQYGEMVKRASPNSRVVINCGKAFVFGGLICGLSQLLYNFILGAGFTEDETSALTIIALIFVAAMLTGIGVYDKIGKHAGAGSIVPITGFANSIAAPAVEFKKEGYVLGVGAKMFAVAGPVIVYGVLASVVVGLFRFFISL